MTLTEQALRDSIRYALGQARAWRLNEGLNSYQSYYWTPRLAAKQHAHWMKWAAQWRSALILIHNGRSYDA